MNPSTKIVLVSAPRIEAITIELSKCLKNLNKIIKVQPATKPIIILGKTDTNGLTNTNGANGLLGKTNALIQVNTPHTPPTIAPSTGPNTIAVIITVTCKVVKLNGPIGMLPNIGIKSCKMIIAVKIAKILI